MSSGSSSGQSVAALQQHHQWLMQQQSANSASSRNNYRSVSPGPRPTRAMNGNSGRQINQQQQQYNAPLGNHNNGEDADVVFDDVADEDDGDDVEEERMIVIQDVRSRSRSPSINRGSGGSIISVQAAPSFCHTTPTGPQESKIVREGWLYKKNGLMQWKPVYAVAKHGTSVKSGSLYLYKDIKCKSHIQTYDMGEVTQVSPRSQEYKENIKWEISMVVKGDDVILAADAMLARKDWIDSLTSIMGKVSIATQNELASRIQSSEQMNRDLQGVAEELDNENQKLKEQFQALKDSSAKKERFFQQELLNRETELKEALTKRERAFQQELQDREEEMNTEMDRQRQALETKCEIFEREAMQWRSKYNELEKRGSSSGNSGSMRSDNSKVESLEIEVRKWKNRVDELEHQQKQTEYRNVSRNTRSNDSSFDGSDTLKETMSDVKFNLQVLRDQIKNSSEGPLLDIKSSVNKLCDTLDDAKMGWNDLQSDIIKFLETERDDANIKDSKQKHMMDLLRNEFASLRQELVGVSADDDSDQEEKDKDAKLPSLSEKFDILIQMVENVQISQSRLSSSMMDNNSTSSSDSGLPSTPPLSHVGKDSELYKAVASQHKQLTEWIQESREMQNSSSTTDIGRLHEKITQTISVAMSEIMDNQQQGQDEQTKNIKVIGNYLKLISNDIQESAIPDLSALSQQLEDVVERLCTTEERLSMLNGTSSYVSAHQQEDVMSFRNMPPPSPSSVALSDDEKLSQLHTFVKNTERFMERSLCILSQYGNNPNGMEETIRRAVKGASKTHSGELLTIQEQNKAERDMIEKKMKRYEENARGFFEKSMEKMHTDLHEFTGVMYGMLEKLVLEALEHSSATSPSAFTSQDDQPQQKSIQNVVELYAKLSGLNQVLKAEITRLTEEKEELESTVKFMKKSSKDLERQIEKQTQQLETAKSEYERIQRDVQKTRHEGTTDLLAKELEPLMQQIAKLRKMAAVNDEFSENLKSNHEKQPSRSKSPLPSPHYYTEEDDEDKLRFPTMNMRSRRRSFTSQYSDSTGSDNKHYDQQSIKSPLIGSRERPRERTPLASYLERNNKQ
ncbi:hypothetical protein BD408DRAFT_401954 [Parasitella parasitica]|nr:hypothetical protein BD408DRAFT_401954 [Parasitella parasitica]